MANPQKEGGFTAVSNELLEAYIKIARFLSPYENTVWWAILRKTYGYNKKEDWISLNQIEGITGIRQSHIARTKKKLLLKNMVTKKNKEVGIQKDYETWNIPKQVLPKQVYIPKQDLPKQVTKLTQTGKKNLPKQVDTKESKDNITKESNTTYCETTAIRNHFYTSYQQHCNKDYVASFGKDGRIFKDLLAVVPLEELKTLVDRFFESEDRFIKDSGYTIGVFRSQINKLRKEQGDGTNRSNNQKDDEYSKYAGIETEFKV